MKKLLIVILISLLVGCASNEKKYESVQGKSIIVAVSDSLLKITYPQSIVIFETINGKDVSSFWDTPESITLEPGDYLIVTSCTVYTGGLVLEGSEETQITLEPEKVYKFSSIIKNDGTCGVSHGVN